MNKKLLTLILAAGFVPGIYAAVPGPAHNFNHTQAWSLSDINGINAAGYATRGIAMFDQLNDVGAADNFIRALNNAAATYSLNDSQTTRLTQLLTIAKALTSATDPVADVNAWIVSNPASPHRADMSLLLADLLLEQGKYGEARETYSLVDIDGLTPALRDDYLYHCAYADLRLGNYAEAATAFADTELNKSRRYANAARFYSGYIKYVDSDYAEAEKLWSKVNTSTMPGMAVDYYRAQIAYLQSRYDAALGLARQLTSRTDMPTTFVAEANRVTGEALYQTGRTSEAIPYLKKYIASTELPERSTQYILGLAQYADGEYADAVASLTPVTTDKSAMGQSAYLYIGQALLKTGDDNGAIMAFNRAVEMDFDKDVTETAYYNYAVAKSRGANVPFASSVSMFEDFLNRFPNSRFADDVAGYIISGYLNDDNYDAALRSIQKIAHPSDNVLSAKQKVLYTLGSRRLVADQADQAVELLQQAAELDRYDAEIARRTSLMLGEALYRTGDCDAAAEHLLAYIGSAPTSDPNRAVAAYDLGYTRMAQQQWDKAATNFERVLANPGNLNRTAIADTYARLGDCRHYLRDWGGAAQAYDAAYNTDPSAGDYPMFQKAIMQGYNRDYEGKVATLDQLISDFPTSAVIPDVLLEKAEALAQINRDDDANAAYSQLIELYPSTPQARRAHLFLGANKANNDDFDGAIAVYQALIASAPTSDEARQADEAVKRLHAAQGTLDQYNDFLSQVEGTPTLDAAEAEKLAWEAAQLAYAKDGSTTLLDKYATDYPTGAYTARALSMLLDDANENDNADDAMKWASLIIANFPDAPAAEDALLIKAQIDYDNERGMDALQAWKVLEQKASDAETKNIARIGIMRVSRDTGDAATLRAAADALLTSSTLGSEEKTEATFSRALAMSLDGETDGAIAAWTELATSPEVIYGAKAAVYATEALNESERYQEAANLAETFVNSGTPHLYWLARGFIALSDAYTGLGRTFEAREYLTALKSNYPGDETDIYDMIDERLNK